MSIGQLDFNSPWTLATFVAGAILLLVLFVIWRKGRPFATANVFRASRLSSGNRLFPTQVHITPTTVVQFTPHWFGRSEHSIHIAHVASVRINTGVLFSDVYIETSGGASPVKCHGHRKRDALEMQRLIEQFQSAYYRQQPPPPPAVRNGTRR
jgi:predicted small integral membrane protein